MSIISGKTSSVLTILKASRHGGPKSSTHRVTFGLPSNIRKIFQDYLNDISRKEYDELLCMLRDTYVNDTDLLRLLKEAGTCVALFNYDMRLFVQALIILDWSTRSDSVILAYKELIHDIVSAHANHTKTIVSELVKLWSKPCDENLVDEWVNGVPSEMCEIQFRNVHSVLKTVLETRPVSEEVLLDSIRSAFPYYKLSTHKHECYVYNMLQVTTYRPDLRSYILQIVIEKLLQLDVNASKEEIQQYEDEVDSEMFHLELDESNRRMKHPIANSLDVIMHLLFNYLHNECYDSNNDGQLLLTEYKDLYKEILFIFENSLLISHATHHVQFLIFYLSSFKTTVAECFLDSLWKHFINLSCPPIVRKNSIAYMASYLARANFVPLRLLETYLVHMSNWCCNYISNVEVTSAMVDLDKHYVFYSVTQALIYLIAFRHKELVDTNKKLVFLQSLNLSKIVTSQLNPLRVCLPAVVQNFAAVTRAYQLVYCYSIIENNTRMKIPVVGKNQISQGSELVLDMYFPFDPYLLLRTKKYITPLYRDYQSSINLEKQEEERLPAEDEDDFINETNLSKHTPTLDFSYSTSPGFKHHVSHEASYLSLS